MDKHTRIDNELAKTAIKKGVKAGLRGIEKLVTPEPERTYRYRPASRRMPVISGRMPRLK